MNYKKLLLFFDVVFSKMMLVGVTLKQTMEYTRHLMNDLFSTVGADRKEAWIEQ